MSQLINPIQGKLSKMRSSQMLRCHGYTESTPLKINLWTDTQKQNFSECHSTHNLKQLQKKQTDNSSRKLTLLQRKSVQKQQSNNFYRNQLCRRKTKYQNQLMETEQKYEKQIADLQEQLIQKMKKEQQIDEQLEYLAQFHENIQQFSFVSKLNDQMLEIFDRKLKEYGVSGCDLIYSAETVFDSKGGQPKVFSKQNKTYEVKQIEEKNQEKKGSQIENTKNQNSNNIKNLIQRNFQFEGYNENNYSFQKYIRKDENRNHRYN